MFVKKYFFHWIMIFLMLPEFIISVPVSSPEISTKPGRPNNNLPVQQQQQQQKYREIQDAQLNTLNAYASNYEMISNNQNQDEHFKPSYKLPEMETNFAPIYNSKTPEFASSLGSHGPVLMQYMPQTINEGGVQYLQLIPTSPLMVPLSSYLPGNVGVPPITYPQHLVPTNNVDFTARPLLTQSPINMPPPAQPHLVDIPAAPLRAYGIPSYAVNTPPYKQNHRTNRETKDNRLLGPISLNLNEYLPQGNGPHHAAYNISGRP